MANNTPLIPIGAQRALQNFTNRTVNGQHITTICNEGTIIIPTDVGADNNIAIYNDGTVDMPTGASGGKKTTKYTERSKSNTTKRNRANHEKSHRTHHRTRDETNGYEYINDDAAYGYTNDAFDEPKPSVNYWNEHGNYNGANDYHHGTSNGNQLIGTNHTWNNSNFGIHNAPGGQIAVPPGSTNGNNIAIYNAPTGNIVVPASVAKTNNLAIHNAPNGKIIMPINGADGGHKKTVKCGRCGQRFTTREDKQDHLL
ncbi:unnamed protein product [Clonostachys solani]|uniref:Uncharacterized protein n=1 Tax=Clonostachys solani TaxID=160281 RepID=A0A9N9Z7L2_9HYPO|nr:unnamed protein product [Clonostachys solani]